MTTKPLSATVGDALDKAWTNGMLSAQEPENPRAIESRFKRLRADTVQAVRRLEMPAIAHAIHYPECWDDVAYPTLESALAEVCADFSCSNCQRTAPSPSTQQPDGTFDKFAEWLRVRKDWDQVIISKRDVQELLDHMDAGRMPQQPDAGEPVEVMRELLELTTKAGRRCAYDLAHAAQDILDPKWRDMYAQSAEHWLTIFNPAKGPKNYHAGLHNEIVKLETRVGKLEALCQENGIDCSEL